VSQGVRCGDISKTSGRPCKGWAVGGTDPPRCSSHLDPGATSRGMMDAKAARAGEAPGTLGERPTTLDSIAQCREASNWAINNLTAGKISDKKAAAVSSQVKQALVILSKQEVLDAKHAEDLAAPGGELMKMHPQELAEKLVAALPEYLMLVHERVKAA